MAASRLIHCVPSLLDIRDLHVVSSLAISSAAQKPLHWPSIMGRSVCIPRGTIALLCLLSLSSVAATAQRADRYCMTRQFHDVLDAIAIAPSHI